MPSVKSHRPFSFDQETVTIFDSMVRRSVPSYHATHMVAKILANRYLTAHTRCYDLGCSLGTTLLAIAPHADHTSHFIGIDSSQPMVAQCKNNIQEAQLRQQVDIICQPIEETTMKPCHMVILNFTLQFIALEKRSNLLSNIYNSLQSGGVLLLSEKLSSDEFTVQCHEDFKRLQGYSEIDIAKKRDALVNVLKTEDLTSHCHRLQQVGFQQITTALQFFNFCSLVAFK